MSHNYNFYFPCFFGVSPFSMGHPFFHGVLPFSRPPAVWLLSRRGFGGGSPARPPATHQPFATPNPCGRGFSLSSFRSSFSFPSVLFAPAVKGSQPRVRPPCVCMSRVCMSRVRWQPCGCVACCTLPLYTFVSTATSCSAYKYIQSSRQ